MTDTATSASRPDDTRSAGFRPIGWWLKEADARLEAAFDLRLRAYGVTSRRGWQVLASAARAPVRRADLVADLSSFDAAAAVEQVVDELAAEGWLTDDDGTLRLTPDGEDLHLRLSAGIAEIRGWVAEALPGRDYQTLVELLQQLVDAFPPAPDEAR
jgi:hypothetical protein